MLCKEYIERFVSYKHAAHVYACTYSSLQRAKLLHVHACNSCKTLIGVHKMAKCTPNKVLQLLCWPMTPLNYMYMKILWAFWSPIVVKTLLASKSTAF